jgi:hypothetical protein
MSPHINYLEEEEEEEEEEVAEAASASPPSRFSSSISPPHFASLHLLHSFLLEAKEALNCSTGSHSLKRHLTIL